MTGNEPAVPTTVELEQGQEDEGKNLTSHGMRS